MYFAFWWMDRWLKIMEAFTAEQARIAESRGEDQITPGDELANLRNALTDREHALLAALGHGKELETALTRQRDAAEERHADYLREIAERTHAVEEAEERLKAELQTATQTQAEVTRLKEELIAAKDELAAAQKDIERSRGELKAAKSETERLKSALEKMQVEVEATRNESKCLATEIAEARVQAETARKDYEGRSAELARKAADAEKACQAHQRERDETRREFDQLRADLDQARADRTAALRNRERLEEELSQLREQTQRERQNAEASVAELNRKLTEAERRPGADPEPTKLDEVLKKPRGIRKAKTAVPNVPQYLAAPKVAPKPETSVDDFVLHFQKPADWSERVFIYYWDTDPVTERPEWPGVSLQDEGDGWRAHRFEGIRAANLIFNDDQGRQTGNLHRDHSGWLAADGTWYDRKPRAAG
jgi:predicted  nucleic acid-binding Zn-ribbon protein